MNGDFSRWTAPNADRRHYKGVLMQQGRPQTDADWNEQVVTALSRSEAALENVIGPSGTPKGEGGFAITPGPGGFGIGAGRYYLGGALVRNDANTTYAAQGGPGLAIDPLPQSGQVIVYLEAFDQHVTAQEDTRLADPALGGIDTATRIRAAWRVGVESVTLTAAQRDALIEAVACGAAPDLPGWAPSTGALSARTLPAGTLPADSDCEIPPEAGYLSQENQLYRVQIVRGGTRAQARFVWSRENGSVQAVLARNATGDFILMGERDDDMLGFSTGNWVELLDDTNRHRGGSGSLHRITRVGDTVTFAPTIPAFDTLVNPRLRRWDHAGNSAQGLSLPTNPTELERGIEISFANGTYRVGDHWIFEARAATGNIVWPQFPMANPSQAVPPMGRPHRRAALALAQVSGQTLANVIDLRAEFAHLTCLEAEDVGFDDTVCQMGAETVQEALETLCRRTSAGLCNIVVANAQELIAAVGSVPAGRSVRICLRAGQFALPRTLEIAGLGHVALVGVGPQTVVSTASGEAAFAFTDCMSVRVTDMSVNGGPTGASGRLATESRLGAVTTIDCGDQSFERLRLRCRAGLDRQAACLSTRNTRRAAQVLVRDCRMSVGQSQIGLQIIGARRAIVEHNTIVPTPLAGDRVIHRIGNDPVLVARVRKSLLSFTRRPLSGNAVQILAGDGQPQGTIDISELDAPRPPASISSASASLEAFVEPVLARNLLTALRQNRMSRVSTPKELRQHLVNLVGEALRDPRGRAFIGGQRRSLLQPSLIRTAYMAQGITIAGQSVEDAHVIGNRVEGAVDCIRIAASSDADPVPASWQRETPPNLVQRARITGNVLAVRPYAESVKAHGLYLGHVENVSVGENDISGEESFLSEKRPMPHYGVLQFGYRGDRLTMTENTARTLSNGFAVLPHYDPGTGVGIWRLRDNAARRCIRPYVVSGDVQVI